MSSPARRAERNAKNRRWDYLRETGRPSLLRGDSAEIQALARKVRSFHGRGMSFQVMAAQVEVDKSTFRNLVQTPTPHMRRATYVKAVRLAYEEPLTGGARVSLVGSQRRLQALRADGFTYEFLSAQMGVPASNPGLQRIMTGVRSESGRAVTSIRSSTARKIELIYDKLAGVDPTDVGITGPGALYASRRARELGYAPSTCWDSDTIDDPMSVPQWTGRCGTVFGAAVHKREGIPICLPCEVAFTGELYPGFSGAMLRELRERRGMSRNELAAELDLNPSTIQYWETGRSKPVRQGKLDDVLNVLDGTYEDVCEDT